MRSSTTWPRDLCLVVAAAGALSLPGCGSRAAADADVDSESDADAGTDAGDAGDDRSSMDAERDALSDGDGPVDGDTAGDGALEADPDADLGADSDADADSAPARCSGAVDCDDGSTCTTDECVDGVCIHGSETLCDWPAETSSAARNLTGIAGPVWDNDFYSDLSGAVWNPVSRTLWVCRNNGPSKIWAVVPDGGSGFEIEDRAGERAIWEEFGDAEGLTQGDFDDFNTVYLLQEGGGVVEEYDLTVPDSQVLNNQWVLTDQLGGDGAEGITFVPDEYLEAQGFVDAGGAPYSSTEGMGGLMFIGHQNGGHIYVFDLNRATGEHLFVARYETGSAETAGLEFDRSTGQLFIWHDGDFDQLEITRLSSHESADGRRLDTIVTYDGPATTLLMSTNREGIALTPIDDCIDGRRQLFMTTDGGRAWSLLLFVEFPC